MWDQGLRDLEAVPALVPVYFRYVGTLWTYSLDLGALHFSGSTSLSSTWPLCRLRYRQASVGTHPSAVLSHENNPECPAF